MISPVPFPRRISVELTNHCNQRCAMCPRLGFTRPLGFMTPSVFERIARECAQHETALWLHFLGEPLLHPEAAALVSLAKQVGVRQVGLSTNGVSLAGARAETLLDAGLDRLECSMDALDRDGYRAMRGRDHFERVTRNVRAFLARKRARGLERPIVSIQFMRTPDVESRLAEIVAAWKPYLGARDFVMTIRPAAFGGAIETAQTDGEATATRPPCPWLFESLMVMQDGMVTMCGADWDATAPLGDVRVASLEAIWTGAEAQRRRAAHLAGRFAEVSPCAACEDWRLADGSGYSNAEEELTALEASVEERRARVG